MFSPGGRREFRSQSIVEHKRFESRNGPAALKRLASVRRSGRWPTGDGCAAPYGLSDVIGQRRDRGEAAAAICAVAGDEDGWGERWPGYFNCSAVFSFWRN